MTGQMTALLIGDEAFRSLIEERALRPLGVLAAVAADVDTALPLARALEADLHAVVFRLPPDSGAIEAALKPVLALCEPASMPLIVVGDGPQAAAAAVNAGASHYLPAGAEADLMEAAVSSATRLCQRWRQIEAERRSRAGAMTLLTDGTFRFRTPDEASALAVALSAMGASPQRLALGLLELMLNAIEHGNLGIGFAEKSRLRAEGRFGQEVDERLARPENRGKWASVEVRRKDDRLSFLIVDDGLGFDWRNPPGALSDEAALHGRGILLARSLGFDDVRYEGCGNRVLAIAERAAPVPNA